MGRQWTKTKGWDKKNPNSTTNYQTQLNQIKAEELKSEQKFIESPEYQIFGKNNQRVNFKKTAFLANVKTIVENDDDNIKRTMLLLVMYDQQGDWLTCKIKHNPYFYIKCIKDAEQDVAGFIEKRYESQCTEVCIVQKNDLEAFNHLSGAQCNFIKVSFYTESDLYHVKNDIFKQLNMGQKQSQYQMIEQLREYDVGYVARVLIDYDIRVSFWYNISVTKGILQAIEKQEQILELPTFSVLAYDIETTKLPLKFPDPSIDAIMLISYTIDGVTFLIVNREQVSQDIDGFDYSPKEGLYTQVIIYNEPNEKASIQKFIQHIKIVKPFIISTFNGDFFDFPFIAERANINGISLEAELGIFKQQQGESYYGRYIFTHMDCYSWVQRDAFLPHGSHGLKAVTKAKLGYNPIEVDPEQMMPMAQSDPQRLAEYSISDSFATYQLYISNIHDYIFALCTIVPLAPDDVLRRGSGALCEHLLMAQASRNNIIFPNKKIDYSEKFYNGHLIDSETYVGGFVQCINNGAYRADIPVNFTLDPLKYDWLIDNVQNVIDFASNVELGLKNDEIVNNNDVKQRIQELLQQIKISCNEHGHTSKTPLIYHVDVSSMYPNIILTNRLQPTAIVNEQTCANCLFNEPKNHCKRDLDWEWKASYYPLSRAEYQKVVLDNGSKDIIQAVKRFSQKTYKCLYKNTIENRTNTVCMRENSFYVDTIRSFRDRRYKYKGLAKLYSKSADTNQLFVYYESMQLAHKIILNSFYGYVMKKGARWYSMEMAAMVTNMGAHIIQDSRCLLDLIGKPLELDTDGIWTLLPSGFPEKFELLSNSGKKTTLNFIPSLMNWLIYDKYKNDQYQNQVSQYEYKIETEMSIFFEVDGPYKAMIIPAAREENKKLKKRYVIFNFNDKITEIKGFEIKRRGELGIIKAFQQDIFAHFLKGDSLFGLFQSCAQCVRKFMQIIIEKGQNIDDTHLIGQLSEMKMLSKSADEYGQQKGIALTAAKRMSEYLGTQILQGRGLNCQFVISKFPDGAPLSERVVPVTVLQLEPSRRASFIKKWLGINDPGEQLLRYILDWQYYYERMQHTIQKIIIIPAMLQGLDNPCPEIACPDWLKKRQFERNTKNKQQKMEKFFQAVPKTIQDIENLQLNPNKLNSTKIVPLKITQQQTENLQIDKLIKEEEEEIQDVSLLPFEKKLELIKKKWFKERHHIQTTEQQNMINQENRGLGEYHQSEQRIIMKNPWNIMKIVPSTNNFKLSYFFAINNKNVQRAELLYTKTIYINSYEKDPLEQMKLSKKKLPRNKPKFFLYETKLSQEIFQQYNPLINIYLSDPSIEGVYETQVSPEFKAIVQHGALSQFPSSFPLTTLSEINSSTLQPVPYVYSHTVLDPSAHMILLWFLNIKNYSFLAIYRLNKIQIVILDLRSNSQKNKTNLKEQIQANLQKVIKEQRPPVENYPFYVHDMETAELEIQIYSDTDKKTKFLNIIAQDLNSHIRHDQIIMISGNKCQEYQNFIKQLNDVPFLEISTFNTSDLNTLSYNRIFLFADRSYQNFIDAQIIFNKYSDLGSLSNIPICNLPNKYENALIWSIDVQFARELLRHYYVWWYSNTQYPDMGSPQLHPQLSDDFLLQHELQCQFINPGFSNTYVYEMKMQNFFLNALIISESILETDIEVIGTNTDTQKDRYTLEQLYTSTNKIGFVIIRDLVKRWWQYAITEQSPAANEVLQTIVKWICAPSSKFYDPNLKLTLDKISQQIFKALINKIDSMGGKIIYANNFKLLIDTKKVTLYSANNFISFLFQSLLKDDQFNHIIFTFTQVYKILLFYNDQNYSGIVSTSSQNGEGEGELLEELALDQKWKMPQILPKWPCDQFVQVINTYLGKYIECLSLIQGDRPLTPDEVTNNISDHIATYLQSDFLSQMLQVIIFIQEQTRLAEIKQIEFETGKSIYTRRSYGFPTASIRKASFERISQPRSPSISNNSFSDDQVEEEEDSFIVDDISGDNEHMYRKTKKKYQPSIITTASKKQLDLEQWLPPTIIGAIHNYENSSIGLINILCEVFSNCSLDINQIFYGIKQYLLQQLDILEFSPKAKYVQPFLQFTLLDVLCPSCSTISSVNLFTEFDGKNWHCPFGHYYPPLLIQANIIDQLTKLFKIYSRPEFQCSECSLIKSDSYQKNCNCSGQYKPIIHPIIIEFKKEVQNNFNNFKQLANITNMTLLNAFLDDLILLSSKRRT